MGTGDSDSVELRFLVPSQVVGVIIGKAGENIKGLRSKFPNRINISENPGPERILSIDGDIDISIDILEAIFQRQLSNQEESLLDIRLLVHHHQAGILIGKGGSKIKDFRETSGLKSLKIYQVPCPNSTDRVVQMVGDIPTILPFIKDVAEILQTSSIKGQIHNYEAAYYDESKSQSYGGWSHQDFGPRNSFGGGKRNRNDNDLSPNFSYYTPNKNSMGSNKYHSRKSPSSGGPMMNDVFNNQIHSSRPRGLNNGHSPNNSMSMGDLMRGIPRNLDMRMNLNPTTTTQVSISDKMIGAIMGKGGARINQVRRDSGADIKIDMKCGDAEDRIITITGTPDQIQNAQFLLQVCVKKYGEIS